MKVIYPGNPEKVNPWVGRVFECSKCGQVNELTAAGTDEYKRDTVLNIWCPLCGELKCFDLEKNKTGGKSTPWWKNIFGYE